MSTKSLKFSTLRKGFHYSKKHEGFGKQGITFKLWQYSYFIEVESSLGLWNLVPFKCKAVKILLML